MNRPANVADCAKEEEEEEGVWRQQQRKILVAFNNGGTDDQWFVCCLTNYQRAVLICIGPLQSKCHFVSARNDPSTLVVTNSSAHIITCLYGPNDAFAAARINILARANVKTNANQAALGFAKWKLELIGSAIRTGHVNHLYDAGLFLCHLTNEFLIRHSLSSSSSSLKASALSTGKNDVETVVCDLVEHLTRCGVGESLVTLRVELTSTKFLRTLLSTLMQSKYVLWQLNENASAVFVDLCLRAFVGSFRSYEVADEKSSVDGTEPRHFAKILYEVNASLSHELTDSQLIAGVLFRLDKQQAAAAHDYATLIGQLKSSGGHANASFKCVLFGCNMSGDFELLERAEMAAYDIEEDSNNTGALHDAHTFLFVDKLKQLVDLLVDKHNVRVILSQKVMHPSLLTHIRRRGVFALDRLSITLVEPISQLSGCHVCSSSTSHEQFVDAVFGQLTSIRVRHLFDSTFIQLENSGAIDATNVQTLLVCVQSESYAAEIQHLLHVAESSFQRTLLSGRALCGGPCFYTYCVCYLASRDAALSTSGSSSSTISSVFVESLQRALLGYARRLVRCDGDYRLSLRTGHLFAENSTSKTSSKRIRKRCVCGLFRKATEVENENENQAPASHMLLLQDLFHESGLLTHRLRRVGVPLLSHNRQSESASHSEPEYERSCEKEVQLIDCLESKVNAFRVMRDILATLLNVGVFVYS